MNASAQRDPLPVLRAAALIKLEGGAAACLVTLGVLAGPRERCEVTRLAGRGGGGAYPQQSSEMPRQKSESSAGVFVTG